MSHESPLHPMAMIHVDAEIGEGTTVGAYSIIEKGVQIGQNCRIAEHVVIREGSHLGDHVVVDSFTVIGGNPQHLAFDPGTKSGVRIGNDVTIREHVTVHRSSEENGKTVVEDGVLLMATAHVGHDSRVGSRCILANQVLLGGYVELGPDVFLGGGAAAHQHCRIGEGVITSGLMQIAHDIPPYVMAAGRDEAHGLNLVGLRRRNVSSEAIDELRRLYRVVILAGGNLRKNAAAQEAQTDEGQKFLAFFVGGKRGFIRSATEGARDDR